MKRILILSFVFLLLFSCSNSPQESSEGVTTIVAEKENDKSMEESVEEKNEEIITEIGQAPQKELVYQFQSNNIVLRPTEKAEEAINQLSAPIETGTAPSCAFEGEDILYRYSGYDIQAGYVRGIEYITGIIITDEKTATPQGLMIGDSYNKMIELYGSTFREEFGQYIYEDEKVQFIVVIEDDKVLTISYIGKFEGDWETR